MRHTSGSPSASIAAAVFSGFSRRLHIDLQRFTSCLCKG
ncbi:putative leader peptide [Streptomyces sp. NPDC001815]